MASPKLKPLSYEDFYNHCVNLFSEGVEFMTKDEIYQSIRNTTVLVQDSLSKETIDQELLNALKDAVHCHEGSSQNSSWFKGEIARWKSVIRKAKEGDQ